MSKVLILSTAHGQMGDTGNKTGVWLEELAVPYYALKDAGHEVVVASIGGATIPVDPNSEPEGDDANETAKKFRNNADDMALLENPQSLADQNAADYDAVFVPGGHGAVWDLASSTDVAEFLSEAWSKDKVLASVCHGPAAFVGVHDGDAPLVKGRKVAAFTDSEEEATGLQEVVPFLLETRLRELGADMQIGADWQPKAVADGRLITGQNPMSSEEVAKLLVEKLG